MKETNRLCTQISAWTTRKTRRDPCLVEYIASTRVLLQYDIMTLCARTCVWVVPRRSSRSVLYEASATWCCSPRVGWPAGDAETDWRELRGTSHSPDHREKIDWRLHAFTVWRPACTGLLSLYNVTNVPNFCSAIYVAYYRSYLGKAGWLSTHYRSPMSWTTPVVVYTMRKHGDDCWSAARGTICRQKTSTS